MWQAKGNRPGGPPGFGGGPAGNGQVVRPAAPAWRRRRGTSALEYALLLSLIPLGCVAVLHHFGTGTTATFNRVFSAPQAGEDGRQEANAKSEAAGGAEAGAKMDTGGNGKAKARGKGKGQCEETANAAGKGKAKGHNPRQGRR